DPPGRGRRDAPGVRRRDEGAVGDRPAAAVQFRDALDPSLPAGLARPVRGRCAGGAGHRRGWARPGDPAGADRPAVGPGVRRAGLEQFGALRRGARSTPLRVSIFAMHCISIGMRTIMATTSMVHVRVDDVVKARATEALAAMGLSISDAVRMLLVRTAAEK